MDFKVPTGAMQFGRSSTLPNRSSPITMQILLVTSCRNNTITAGCSEVQFRVLCGSSIYLRLGMNCTGCSTSQVVPSTPGQPVKEPMFIPVSIGLLDSSGKDIPFTTLCHDGVLQTIASKDEPVFTIVLRVTKRMNRRLWYPPTTGQP